MTTPDTTRAARAAGSPDPALFGPGSTILTANKRLSRALQRQHAARARRDGLAVWETPDILPWGAWLQRCWETLLMQQVDGATPAPGLLLGSDQTRALWERIINESEAGQALLRVPATARQAAEARGLGIAWRVELDRDRHYGRDVGAWLDWSARFEARCREEGWIDDARLPDLVRERIESGELAPPQSLALAGFDGFTPQQQALLDAVAAAGCAVTVIAADDSRGHCTLIPLKDAAAEIEAAAQWARARLAARPDARIGIVVPDLPARRAQVARVFEDVLHPGAALPGAAAFTPLYNLSAGAALADCPPVHDALLALELAGDALTLAEAGVLLRSPFLAGAETEFAARALLDARLRERGDDRIDCAALLTPSCPRLAAILSRLVQAATPLRTRRLRPSDWAERFLGLLGMLGWPGERTLDSDEYQAVDAFRELVSGLCALDRVQPEGGFRQTLAQLRRACNERMFQPERPDAPIQVLGLLEASGLGFDHLWLLGLHDAAWPQAPEPNPFLPVAVQRQLGLPRSSPEREYAVAERITARLLAAAPEVCVSYPLGEADRVLRPSPLIASLDRQAWPLPGVGIDASHELAIHEAGRQPGVIETIGDARGPALAAAQARGGSQIFEHQSACPFRAFARLRLRVKPLEEPEIGLPASRRGTLLHQVLERLWRELGSQAALRALDRAGLDALLGRIVDGVVDAEAAERPQLFTERFRALERRRLLRVVREWVEFEDARGDFTVEAVEQRATVTAGGVAAEVCIDRIDRLADGSLAIIDYKTGEVGSGAWIGDRPDQPQLPLYSLLVGEQLGAVLFAQIRPGASKWIGVARDDEVVPNVKAFERTRAADEAGGWPGLIEGWRRVLTGLGEAFRAGDAKVDPKNPGKTCAHCGLTPLCRIHESTSPADGGPDLDESEAGG